MRSHACSRPTGAVATSGCYERGPHLINPKDGQDAVPNRLCDRCRLEPATLRRPCHCARGR